MKHKTAYRIIIHVGKNDIWKEQSELLKKDFSELFETLQRLEVSSSSVDHSQQGELHVFTVAWAEYMATKNLQYKRSQLHRQLQSFLGAKQTWCKKVLKNNIYFSLHSSFSRVCQSTQPEWHTHHTHTWTRSMSDHRTSYQLLSHHVVDTSHKDTVNTTQPKQYHCSLDIPAEPIPQSLSQTDCDVLHSSKTQHPRTTFWKTAMGSQDNISQPPETPEPEPRSPYTLSLSSAAPLLSFSQKMEELVYAGTKLSHSFAASPQISTKIRRPMDPAHPPPPVRALQPLPQRQGPNPPPSGVGEPKTTDSCSQ